MTEEHPPEHVARPSYICTLSSLKQADCAGQQPPLLKGTAAPADSPTLGGLLETITALSLGDRTSFHVPAASTPNHLPCPAHAAVALFIPLLPLLSHKEISTIPEFLKENAQPACWPRQFWQLGKGMCPRPHPPGVDLWHVKLPAAGHWPLWHLPWAGEATPASLLFSTCSAHAIFLFLFNLMN